ncbi:MAG TPA: hypothetical protein VIO61_13500 [Anaerolineaceae bacterium]
MQPVFANLIFDEENHPVEVAYVGGEPCYVVNDRGFRRHIPSEQVDRQVLEMMKEQVKENEDIITDQTAKMLGQDDIFSRAMILNQLKNIDQQIETLLQIGLPEDARAYLGMMGMRVVINVHGDVIRFEQPGMISGEEGDE